MSEDGALQLTQLLRRASDGDEQAREELYRAVHGDLRRQAKGFLRGQPQGHELQATALVNETYLRLVRLENTRWEDRHHFFAVAASAMRSILVDHARAKGRLKRQSTDLARNLDAVAARYQERAIDLLQLDEALEVLGREAPEVARLVELRFFGGLTMNEVARVLGCSKRAAERDWTFARAWLRDRLR